MPAGLIFLLFPELLNPTAKSTDRPTDWWRAAGLDRELFRGPLGALKKLLFHDISSTRTSQFLVLALCDTFSASQLMLMTVPVAFGCPCEARNRLPLLARQRCLNALAGVLPKPHFVFALQSYRRIGE